MYSKLIFYIVLIGLCDAGRKKKENRNNRTAITWRKFPSNCSNTPIDVRLYDLSAAYTEFESANLVTSASNPTGLLEILHPRTPSPMFVCYPQDITDLPQIYTLSHVACRQLGFMTFVDVKRKELSTPINGKPYHGLGLYSYSCTGKEQDVTHCSWNNISIEVCPILTEVSCGSCHEVIKDFSGIVKSPGYPLMFFFDMTCQWDIIVPEKHTILLTFNQFDAMQSELLSHICDLHKPHIEITYGYQNQFSVYRYCNLQDVKNLSIPFHEVKIRIFSGYYPSEKFFKEKEQGLVFTFEAIPVGGHSSLWKIILVSLVFAKVIITAIACYYCKRSGICDYKRQNVFSGPNAPAADDLNRAYEFQRCNIQRSKATHSLRLRSGESWRKSTSQFFPHSTETNYEVAKDFRKQLVQVETPRNFVPEIVLNGESGNSDKKQNAILRAKANLLDRYSKKESLSSTNRLSVSSSVFYPPAPSFQIYHSESSDKELSDKDGKKEPDAQITCM